MSELLQTINPSVTTIVPYSAGESVGALMIFNKLLPKNIFSCMIHTVLVTDGSNQCSPLDLVILSGVPAVASNNASVFDLAGPDSSLYVGHIPILSTDYSSWNTTAGACVKDLGLLVNVPAGIVYAQLVARGAPTFQHLNDIRVSILALINF
jgi:hypothetical protein